MSTDSPKHDTRFPWGYAVASLLPIALIGGLWQPDLIWGPDYSMGLAMACSLLLGPTSGVVIGWGAFRLMRGDGERYPALVWLMLLPIVVGVVGFVLA
jgi:hypothetical protein